MTQPVALPRTEDHLIRSAHVGADFRLWIAHPVPGWSGPSPLPTRVLYLLDADMCFGAAVDMTRLMHQLYGELPPILVVGIAYGGGDPAVHAQLRNRDLTPTSTAEYEAMMEQMGGATLLPAGQRLGRAAQFLAFLRDEVRPFVEASFGVSNENSILFGSSLGGLFAVWTLLTAPDSFANYISASPALWWDDELAFGLEQAMTRTDTAAGVYLAVGEEEENPHIPMLARFKLVSNTTRMHDALAARAHPSLRLSTEVIAGESHTSVIPAALTRGLRRLTR
jgi:predicted alpha/beta superfamily hydrolase